MGWIRKSFKRQIFVVFLTVTLVLVIFGGILTLQGFQARIRADYEKRDIEQDRIVTEQLRSDFAQIEASIEAIAGDKVIQNALKSRRSSSLAVYSALYEDTQDIREFSTIELYSGSNCVYSTQGGYSAEHLPEYYAVLKDASEAGDRAVYALDPDTSSETGAALLVARKIGDVPEAHYVVVRLDQEEIRERIGNKINARDGFMLTNEFLRAYCLLGIAEDGRTLATIRSNLMNGSLYNAGIDSNVYISEIGGTGLLGIYLTPPPLDASAVHVVYQIILIQALIAVLICLLVASRMSSHLSRPIDQLSSAMKRFRKGDFDTRIELGREDEFEQLATSFNKMASQLNQTMEERVQAEHKMNEARIRMMQAQLNPHFLYNTLDTIKWVAKGNQVPEIATMSASLAGILRTGISEKQFCLLSQEIKLVENYCDIQKIRFDDSFDLSVEVPSELENAIIPKLILQPIVENAIIHGFEDRQDGHIRIEAKAVPCRDPSDLRHGAERVPSDPEHSEAVLEINITDNGSGISDEMIEILSADDPETLEGHLGLGNVNTIIRLYYGKEYGVKAGRPEEGGTVMTVTLPLYFDSPE